MGQASAVFLPRSEMVLVLGMLLARMQINDPFFYPEGRGMEEVQHAILLSTALPSQTLMG